MAISPEQQYPDKTTPASLDYPQGQARNVTTPGDGTGTPLEQAWVNDLFGFEQALLDEAGIAPSGVPDTARNSQYLDAMKGIFADNQDLAGIMNRLHDLENRVYEDTAINQLIYVDQHFETSAQVAAYKGYGVWERALKGRVAVGFSDIVADNSNFKTFGATYGAATVTLDVTQIPAHKHAPNDQYNKFVAVWGDWTDVDIGKNTPDFTGAEEDGEIIGKMSLSNWNAAKEKSIGGGQAHNNLQPSKTLDCWKRIG